MIRKLMQSIREYKLSSLLSPLFVVLEVVMEVVIPILMAKLIDDGIDGDGGMDAILHIGGILLVCCVASLLFGALAGHFAAHASAGFARICGTTCSIGCRPILSPTSTSSPPPALSPV